MILKALALDPATHTGWAISNEIYGVWNLSILKDESDGMRIIRFRAKLKEICEKEYINVIAFERPAGRFARAIITQSELISQIKSYSIEHNIQYRAYSASEIKKFATGKGNANKDMMIKAAKEQLKYKGNNSDEADALWILNLLKEQILK